MGRHCSKVKVTCQTQKAIKAIWHHYASKEDNGMHEYCPAGADS